jgi:hypothetical protein
LSRTGVRSRTGELNVRAPPGFPVVSDDSLSNLVKLAGADKVRVSCCISQDEWKTLRKGDKVVIKGDISSGFSPRGKEISVQTAFILKKD